MEKDKLANSMALSFTIAGVILEIVTLVMLLVIPMFTENWAFMVLGIMFQFYVIPYCWLLCGFGGLIFSILALQKVGKKKRYQVTLVISIVMIILGVILAVAGGNLGLL